jgi:hypothetical protein
VVGVIDQALAGDAGGRTGYIRWCIERWFVSSLHVAHLPLHADDFTAFVYDFTCHRNCTWRAPGRTRSLLIVERFRSLTRHGDAS